MAETSDGALGVLLAIVVAIAGTIGARLLLGDASAGDVQDSARGFAPSGGGGGGGGAGAMRPSTFFVMPTSQNPDGQTDVASDGAQGDSAAASASQGTDRNPDRSTTSANSGGGRSSSSPPSFQFGRAGWATHPEGPGGRTVTFGPGGDFSSIDDISP